MSAKREKVKLGDLIENRNDFWDRSSTPILKYIAANHLDEDNLKVSRWSHTDDPQLPPTFNRLFLAGEVIIHSRNPKKVVVPDFDGLTGEKLFILRSTDKKLLQNFLSYVLVAVDFQDYARTRSSGSVNKFLNWTTLKEYEFYLPPIEEQKRIVKVMQGFDRHIQDLYHALGNITETEKQYIEYLLKEVAEVKTLGELCDLSIGKTPPRKSSKYWTVDNKHPFCTIADMKGKHIKTTRQGITSLAIADKKAKLAEKGTLLMSFKLTLGRMAFAGADIYPNEAIVSINPKEDDNYSVNKDYLFYFLPTLDLQQYSSSAVKGKTLNKESLSGLPIKLPSIEDQKIVVEKMRTLELCKETILQKIDESRYLKIKTLQQMIGS